MHHPTGMATAVFEDPVDGFKGPFATSILCQEFYESDPSRGFQMQAARLDGPLGAAVDVYLPRVPWGAGHHARFREILARAASLTVTTEDLPREESRVTLDPDLTDRMDVPAPKMTYVLDDDTHEMIRFGLGKAETALREAGAREVVTQDLVTEAGFHLLGAARMGEDPETSVTDAFGRLHDCPNATAAHGSVLVTAAALNPTPTLQAMALPAADAMLRERGA